MIDYRVSGLEEAGLATVATYNIHKGVGGDRRRNPERIAQVLAALRCDVIALQEVDLRGEDGEPSASPYFAPLQDYEIIAAPTFDCSHGTFGNVLLTRFPIVDVRRCDLAVARCEPRGAIDVDLDARGAILRVVTTHLGLRGRERSEQVERILERLAARHRKADVTVLLGDINEWRPRARPLRRLDRELGPSRALRTFPSSRPFFALDRIWVSPASQLLDVEVWRDPPARIASDHLPVRATLSLGAPTLRAHDGGETTDREATRRTQAPP